MTYTERLRAAALAAAPWETAMASKQDVFAALHELDRLRVQRDWLICVAIGLFAGLGYAGNRLANAPTCAAPSASELVGDPENVVQLETLRIGPERLTAPGGNRYAL